MLRRFLFLYEFYVDVASRCPDQRFVAVVQFETLGRDGLRVDIQGMRTEGVRCDFVPVKYLAGVTVEEFALFGKTDAGAAAFQEFCPEFVLEIGNILGYGRLGNLQ